MLSVYALSDPRTGEVKYIGLTNNVKRRYTDHISGKDKSNKAKQSWIDDLKTHNLLPTLTILEENLEKPAGFQRERSWLQTYLEQGADLTNMRDARLWPIEQRCSDEELLELIEQRRIEWERGEGGTK